MRVSLSRIRINLHNQVVSLSIFPFKQHRVLKSYPPSHPQAHAYLQENPPLHGRDRVLLHAPVGLQAGQHQRVVAEVIPG